MTKLPFSSINDIYDENQTKNESTSFKKEIKHFVEELDAKPTKKVSIGSINLKLHAKRRRLYDVINVLAAVGCVTRSGSNDLFWNGKKQIVNELIFQKKQCKIDDWSLTLEDLFPADKYVSLASLTIAFLLLFPALDVNAIDLKTTCIFFSRNTNRYKTTLCKLYQIILILSALDIVCKSNNARQIYLLSPYRECLLDDKINTGPESIEFLLNRTDNDKNQQIKIRRDQFLDSFIKKKNGLIFQDSLILAENNFVPNKPKP